jgi:hypothetical protein
MTTLPALAEVTCFVALLKQAGDGCDYTIECGTKVVALDATTAEEAVIAGREMLREYRDERQLESMQILALAGSFAAPVDTWYKEFKAEADDAVAAKQRMTDYAELMRLHERLGLPPPAPLSS